MAHDDRKATVKRRTVGPSRPGSRRPALIESDLLMLVCHNGRERTLAEYEEFLMGEGFRLESVSETGSPDKIITASATPAKLPWTARRGRYTLCLSVLEGAAGFAGRN